MELLAALPFTLRQLQYLVAVADQRSFRHAAEACHVSQPSLSAQVAQVEDLMDVTVFDRSRRPVAVTAAGAELLAHARRVLAAARTLAEAAGPLGDPLRGVVRIGIIPTMAPYLLPSLTPALAHAFPRLVFTWTEEKTPTLVEAIEAGSLDAAVLALESDLGELRVRPLATDPFLFAAPAGHPLIAQRDPPRADDLADVTVYVLDDGHCFRDQVLDVCYRSGAHEAGFRATSLATLVSMAAASPDAVTLLPAMATQIVNRSELLATRPFAAPVPKRTVALAWRGGAPIEHTLEAIGDTFMATVTATTEASC